MVYTKKACEEFLKENDASAIAAQLRQDQERARQGLLPSLLARYLPRYSDGVAKEVAKHLSSASSKGGGVKPLPSVQRDLERLQYEGILTSLRAHIKSMDVQPADEGGLQQPTPTGNVPNVDELETALKVVGFLMSSSISDPLAPSSSVGELVHSLRQRLGPSKAASRDSTLRSRQTRSRQRCYICQYYIRNAHPEYSRLCWQCGEFNVAESKLSLPENLSLVGRVALVTGGRVKLGFHVALRLLRCGAHVIISSRYPQDAERRYLAEEDAGQWQSRLKIVGADFRTARDVFRLSSVVRQYVQHDTGLGRLDILVNNAAQTLTDTVAEEKKALRHEDHLKHTKAESDLLIADDVGYSGQVRGGQLLTWTSNLGMDSTTSKLKIAAGPDVEGEQPVDQQPEADNNDMHITELPIKTSWTQSLTEIPYEDVITAYSVNALSVHILICELLPLMELPKDQNPAAGPNGYRKPGGYIINVSSREGIFENSPDAGHKNGKHVHTNTSKAALNMITETEAWPCWRDRRVAMNTVDPGYMSAAPEFEKQGSCPIGFEDGAGRVLWPIAQGEAGSKAVWGRFLKHYGRADVQVKAGRG